MVKTKRQPTIWMKSIGKNMNITSGIGRISALREFCGLMPAFVSLFWRIERESIGRTIEFLEWNLELVEFLRFALL